jgi:hypothetical protein
MEPMVDIVSAPNVKERPGEAGDIGRTDKSFPKGWRDRGVGLKVSIYLDFCRRPIALILCKVCEDRPKVVLGRMMRGRAGRKDKLLSRLACDCLGRSNLKELVSETSLEIDREHCVGRREMGWRGNATAFTVNPVE